jgi:3-oxoacyl-[acyl-carrier protein] reductase
VRVNAVAPALVEGGFVQRLNSDLFEQRRRAQIERAPLRRVGKPEDIAETVYWLVTGAPLMTGEILTADCGLHLNADS